MAEAAAGADRPSLSVGIVLPALAGAAALSILAQGFQLPGGTNSWHFPLLFDWLGSAEGPDDAFTRSLERFASQVWPLLSLIADEGNWPWVLSAAHYLTRLATLAALFLLLDRLSDQGDGDGRRRALAVACLLGIGLACFRQSPLGGGEVMLDEFSHSSLNVPLALLLFLAAAGGRWWWAGLLLGLLFNVNAFVALWLGLATAAAYLRAAQAGTAGEQAGRGAAWRGAAWRAAAWRAVGPLALALLLALPTALRIAEALAAAEPPPGFDFRAFLAEFYGGHFLVESVPPAGLFAFLLLLAGIAWLWRREPAPGGAIAPAARHALGSYAAVLALVALFGVLLPYVSASALLLNLHPMRMDFLLVWLFYLGFGLLLVRRGRLDLPAGLALLSLFAGLLLPLALLLPLLGRREPDQPGAGAGARAPATLCLLLAAGVLLLGSFPTPAFTAHRWTQSLDLGLLLGLLLWGAATRRLDPPFAALVALLALLSSALGARLLAADLLPWDLASWRHWAAGALLLGAALRRRPPLPRPAPAPPGASPGTSGGSPTRHLPAIALALAAVAAVLPGARHLAETGHLDRYDARSLSFLQAQRWAREATPPGSLFLAPDWQLSANLTPSFWTLSRRPVWVDWRQGAAVHWQPSFYPLWRQRMARAAGLSGVAEKLAFAGGQGIDFVILGSGETLPATAPAPVYDDGITRILPVGTTP